MNENVRFLYRGGSRIDGGSCRLPFAVAVSCRQNKFLCINGVAAQLRGRFRLLGAFFEVVFGP